MSVQYRESRKWRSPKSFPALVPGESRKCLIVVDDAVAVCRVERKRKLTYWFIEGPDKWGYSDSIDVTGKVKGWMLMPEIPIKLLSSNFIDTLFAKQETSPSTLRFPK